METELPIIDAQAGVYLDDKTKKRVARFLETVDGLLWEILTPELRKIYDCHRVIQMFADYGMTIRCYVEFLNACHEIAQMTGLPFSLEEAFGGLKTWDAWNTAVDTATENAKRRFTG